MSNEKTGDASYFDGLEGNGLEGFTADTVSVAYLAMIQPGSTVADENNPPGSWRNSATGENFGPTVRVIPLAFKTVWTERDKDPPFNTVGRYEPNSIAVRIERPKPGKRGFPKMYNDETGNKVEELFIYACLIEDRPETGILYFSPTVGSMKTCKQWNSMLRSQRLPNGKIAPIFAFSWDLELALVQNPVKPSEKITRFIKATRCSIVDKELFFGSVQPAIAASASTNAAMLTAPEQSGDAEPSDEE
jgi:hypothetical protein